MHIPHSLRSGARRERASHVTRFLVALAALSLMLCCDRALAIDPHRALTQALLRKWQVQQGLPQATILSIHQTSDGYLWLGTQSGLFHFDGVRFAAAQCGSDVSLNKLWIQDLCEDHDHNLWIATNEAGLIRLRDRTATQFSRDEGLPSANVQCLLVDRRGELWAGTDDDLVRWSNGTFVVYGTEQGIPTNNVRALCQTVDGSIWIGGDNWLGVWNGSSFSSHVLNSLPARCSIRALLGASDGSVWIGTTAGLVRSSGDNEKRITRADGLADDSIECLTQSRDGSIWVGTKDGISRLQGRDIESFRTRDGLSQSTVFTLCEDHEGNLWAGTKHGLNQFVDRRTIPLTVSEGLPSNDTGPLLQDRAGRVWVGTLDKGLARYDGRHCSLAATVEQGLSSNSILSLADGGNDDLWIGTDQGLCLMRDGRIIDCFTSEHGLPSNEISCLCRDRRGVLWAGTSRGLAEFDSGRFVRPDGDEGALRLPILALVEYGGKCVVTSTEGGRIFQCDDRHFRPFGGDSIGSQNVHAFYEDRDASLWMGTLGNGLELVDGDTTLRITVKDGLYDDDIFGIVADDEDRLWMACSRGIFFVSRPELRRFARGEITNVTSTPFSPTDALRTVECQSGVQPAVWRMQDGHIWFSTNHGVIVIDPSNLRRVLPLPQVHVEEVLVNGQDVNPGQVGNLPPGRTTVSFRYTALSYASPTRITFRYRLDGFDKEWIEAGSRREAFYTNLPPGSYRFRVSAMNPQSAWSDATLPVEFTLAPYFYQRVWFIPLMFAFVVMVAMVVFRLRVLQVKAHWNAVVAERGRIARELHDTLIQGFSGVTMQMQALAAALRPSRERAKLEEIIEDAGLCLRDARRSVGGLRIASTNDAGLAAAVAQAARQLTETRDVRLVLQVSNCRNVPTDVEYNLLRIAQEAISNAVKYSEGRTIEVTLSSTPQQLCLTVRDDGAGFVVNNTEQLQSGHYGLIGMRERAKQINAELHVLSEPGHGTTVRVELPLTALAAIKSSNHRRSGERFSEESS